MAKKLLPDWEKYWANFKDLNVLYEKDANLDDTLQLIEKEFAVKLMSGDHLMLLSALENRIDQLVMEEKILKGVEQADLFENM